MNRIGISFIMTFSVLIVFGQSLPNLQNLEKLEVKGFNPRFSPSGDLLLVTNEKFRGLSLYDLEKKKIKLKIDEAKGYGAIVTDDAILFESEKSEGGLEVVDIRTSAKRVASSDSKTHKSAFLSSVIGENEVGGVVSVRESADLNKIVLLNADGEEQYITPLGKRNYLNVSLSPDRTRVLFRVSGRGSFVADLKGSILADLGNVEFPAWLDSQTVIYTITEDDGYNYVYSAVYVAIWDGTRERALKLPEHLIPIYPSVDAEGEQLSFNTPEGDIYIGSLE